MRDAHAMFDTTLTLPARSTATTAMAAVPP
jgi:hypothetical protein